MNEIRKISEFIVDISYEELPEDLIKTAKLHILDSFAVSAGVNENEVIDNILKSFIDIYSSNQGIDIWGTEIQLPLVQAVFLNSMKGHVLELDDVHINSKTHIGTVVVPTALGLAQYLNANGKSFIESVICGYEVMSRVGKAFGVTSHRNKGWHATSTAGTFGAAAVGAKLLGLDVKQTISALGMAGTQSFGLWSFLESGANSKILHPARAASSGLEAAILAKSGLTGPECVFDAKDGGLLNAMSDEYDITKIIENLGLVYEIENVDIKPYPCCRSTHCAIDSILKLKEEYVIDINQIEKIYVDTYFVGYKQCGLTKSSKKPQTITEAKFSTPYVIAIALLNNDVTLEEFNLCNLNKNEVKKLLCKIEVRPNDIFTARYPDHWGCKTTIIMKGGFEISKEVKDALGSFENPFTINKIIDKVNPLLEKSYGMKKYDLINKFLKIEDYQSLSELKV